MFAYYMSERITIVVPDGTRIRLKEKAKNQGHTASAFGRKALLDALKECNHIWGTKGDGKLPYSALEAVCVICGAKPNPVA
jgi:hypothetical protein